MCEQYCGKKSWWLDDEFKETIMKKQDVTKNCAHCKADIANDTEFLEFKGQHFHPDRLICIGNLKSQVESYKILLTEIQQKIEVSL